MAKMTSNSKEIILNAPLDVVRQKIYDIPEKVKTFEILSDKQITNTITFYLGNKRMHKRHHYIVEVALNQLSDNETRAVIVASYADGASFDDTVNIDNAIKNMERAITSAIEGTLNEYKEETVKLDSGKCLIETIILIVALLAIIYSLRLLF